MIASAARDITSRTADPKPLTTDEVFPGTRLQLGTDQPPYTVLLTHADTECDAAATGELARMLDRWGCSQVIRATLVTPAPGYLVTTGVFNLADSTAAARAHEDIKPVVDRGRGRFAGMAAGLGSQFLEDASAQVGWHTRGHYLVYSVIERAVTASRSRDGDPHAPPDPVRPDPAAPARRRAGPSGPVGAARSVRLTRYSPTSVPGRGPRSRRVASARAA